jgi:hypothetical protein
VIVRDIGSFIKRWLLTFIWIVVVLVAVGFFMGEIREAGDAQKRLEAASRIGEELKQHQSAAIAEAQAAAAKAEVTGVEAIDRRIKSREDKIASLAATITPFGPLDLLQATAFEKAKAHLDLELLLAERSYLQQLRMFIVAARDMEKAKANLEVLRLAHVAAYAALAAKQAERWEVEKTIWPFTPFWSEKRSRWRELDGEVGELSQANQRAFEAFETARKALETIKGIPRPSVDALKQSAILDTITQLHEDALAKSKGWLGMLGAKFYEALPMAVYVLAAVFFIPPLIRALLYYLIAPLAASRPAVCLIPSALGRDEARPGSRNSVSSVSREVVVDGTHELLVHQEYLQSSGDQSSKRTKWLLDWKVPFSSLLSGMYLLTRIRCSTPQAFVLSSKGDPLSELGSVEIREGEAIVLQPRGLVAVVQPIGRPVKITKHWRLGHLSAWMTLQLRYLVFHGPATLIVKGCRGVRVESAGSGRSISQSATLGFSAQARYSVRRIETFTPYVMGKQGLFNDNFSGESVYYVYEEVPRGDSARGLTGFVEGTFDAALKVFGI